jgi:hypothetical protein
MQNPPKAAVEGSPRLFATEADAQTAIMHLTEVIDGLEIIVEQETALVRAGQLRMAADITPRKSELASRYFQGVERLKANAKFISRVLPKDVSALGRRHDVLQGLLKTNLMVLATAHAVSESIVRRLSGDLARKASPQVYGASGRTTAPNPKLARPLALSRTS